MVRCRQLCCGVVCVRCVVLCCVVLCCVVLCCVVLCCVVLCCVVLCCVVLCCVVLCCVVLCCVVLCCVVLCCVVPKALLPEGNGRDVYPRVQVNGRAVCLSARCVLVCCCTARPVHSRTWPVLLCRHLCTVTQGLVGPPHHVCCAAPSVLCVQCRAAWCCAPHCTVCALPHCTCGQWAVGNGTPATHCHTAWRLWAVQLVLCTASLLGGSGQWSSCYAPPDCLGAVGSGTPAMQRHTAWGQWAVDFLQCCATLPGDGGQWNTVAYGCCMKLLRSLPTERRRSHQRCHTSLLPSLAGVLEAARRDPDTLV